MTKEEIVKKHADGAIFSSGLVYDGFTDAIYSSMDEYAKQQCLEFVLWVGQNELDVTQGCPHISRSPEELYELFINNPSK